MTVSTILAKDVSVAISNFMVTAPTGPTVLPLVTRRVIGLLSFAPFLGSVGIGRPILTTGVRNVASAHVPCTPSSSARTRQR